MADGLETFVRRGGMPRSAEDVARPVSPIEEQLSRLRSALSDLHETISVLESRLHPVMRTVPSQVSDKDCTSIMPTRSSITSAVCDHSDGTIAATRRLQELMERLDV